MRLFLLFIGFMMVSGAAQADCATATMGTKPTGYIFHNADYDVMQVCRADGTWQAISPINCPAGDGCNPDPCAGSPSIGTTCSDGSIYAGLSPDGNVPMYTTPADAPSLYTWNDGTTNDRDIPGFDSCTDNTPGTATTCQTGEANTAFLVGATGEPDYPFAAAEYCDGLSAHGHSDWYLPAQDELDVLYDNKNAGDLNGTFDESGSYPAGWYWSSSEGSILTNTFSRRQRFNDGSQGNGAKDGALAVRCVRR